MMQILQLVKHAVTVIGKVLGPSVLHIQMIMSAMRPVGENLFTAEVEGLGGFTLVRRASRDRAANGNLPRLQF